MCVTKENKKTVDAWKSSHSNHTKLDGAAAT